MASPNAPSTGSAPPGDLISVFLNRYESDQTRRAYRHDLEGFFGEETAGLADARAASTEEILTHLRNEAESVGRQTLRRRATTLKSFFEWLAEEGKLQRSPFPEADSTRSLIDRLLNKGEDGQKEGASNQRSPAEPEEAGPIDAPSPVESSSTRETFPVENSSTRETFSKEDSPSAGNASPDDSSTKEERPKIPAWIRRAAEAEIKGEPRVHAGTRVPLPKAPQAIRYALSELSGRAERRRYYSRSERCKVSGGRFEPSVEIELLPEEDVIEATIDYRKLQEIARHDAGGLGIGEGIPFEAIEYLHGRGWALPKLVLKQIRKRPPMDEDCPEEDPKQRWPRAGEEATWREVAQEVVAVFAVALEMEKAEEIRVSIY